MKKIFILFVLISFIFLAKSQGKFPVETFSGNLKTEAFDSGARGVYYGIHFRHSYTDTAQANLIVNGVNIKSIGGFLILANDTIWLRNHTATRWLKVGVSSGGGGGTDTIYLQPPLYAIKDTVLHTYTIAIYDASATSSGVVNTTAQPFAGIKTFNDLTYFQSGIGTNGAIDLPIMVNSVSVGKYAALNRSWAFGESALASGLLSTSFGAASIASGQTSFAGGNTTVASGLNSTSLGTHTQAIGDGSTALGDLSVAYSFDETSIGANPTSYTPSSTTTWVLSDRLFTIGNGANQMSPSNALVMLKNGNTQLNGNLSIRDTLFIGKSPIASNSDSAFVWDRTTNQVRYAKINGSGGGTGNVRQNGDGNVVNINNVDSVYTSTVTASGTTTLIVNSKHDQYFTGTSPQTVVLPAANTLITGHEYFINNKSTSAITVNYNGGTLAKIVNAGTSAYFKVTDASTSTGVWDIQYTPLFVYNEKVTGSTSSTFTLANTPIAGTFWLSKNGPVLTPITDYTISGNTVTLVSPRLSGDVFLNFYQY